MSHSIPRDRDRDTTRNTNNRAKQPHNIWFKVQYLFIQSMKNKIYNKYLCTHSHMQAQLLPTNVGHVLIMIE